MSPKARFFAPLLVDFSSCPSSSPLLDEEGVSVGMGGSWLFKSASSGRLIYYLSSLSESRIQLDKQQPRKH